jgi:hypothetical protein
MFNNLAAPCCSPLDSSQHTDYAPASHLTPASHPALFHFSIMYFTPNNGGNLKSSFEETYHSKYKTRI